jgi:hypothetical protein
MNALTLAPDRVICTDITDEAHNIASVTELTTSYRQSMHTMSGRAQLSVYMTATPGEGQYPHIVVSPKVARDEGSIVGISLMIVLVVSVEKSLAFIMLGSIDFMARTTKTARIVYHSRVPAMRESEMALRVYVDEHKLDDKVLIFGVDGNTSRADREILFDALLAKTHYIIVCVCMCFRAGFNSYIDGTVLTAGMTVIDTEQVIQRPLRKYAGRGSELANITSLIESQAVPTTTNVDTVDVGLTAQIVRLTRKVSAGDVPVTMEYVIDDNNKLAVVPVDIVKTVVERIIGNGTGTGITVTSSEHVNSPFLEIALARTTMPRCGGVGVTSDEKRLYYFLCKCAEGQDYRHEASILQAQCVYYRSWIDTKAAKNVGLSAKLQRAVDHGKTLLDVDPIITPIQLAIKFYKSENKSMKYLTKMNGIYRGASQAKQPYQIKDLTWLYDDDDNRNDDNDDTVLRTALRLVGSATTDENDAISRIATTARAKLAVDHPNLLPPTITDKLSDRTILLLQYTTNHKEFPEQEYKLPVTNTTPLLKWDGKTKSLLPIGSHWSCVKKMNSPSSIADALILCNSLGAWSDGRTNPFKAYFNGKTKHKFNFDETTGALVSRK